MPYVKHKKVTDHHHNRDGADDAHNVLERPPTAMIRESLNSRYDIALSRLEARTCHSWKMALDGSKVLTAAASIGGTATPQLTIRSAHGSRVIDVDDNEYVDLCMGFGSNLLGHSPEVVEQAIINQTRKGWNFGLNGESQLAFANLIRAAGTANERVQFCASGSEATAIALRAARAFTGKDVIGVFEGAYHGLQDYALITNDPRNPALKMHVGLGIPNALNEVVEPLPYGSDSAFERIRDLKHLMAAVIVEPVRSSFPQSDEGEWLRQLETVCQDCGVLVILDEVTTGFRIAYGGGQERFNLSPDLVAYGKAMAGGLPVGALAGREDIMKVFSPGKHRPAAFAGSAFAGNPLSVAAGCATLSYLQDQRSTLYQDLEQTAEHLSSRLNASWSAANVPLRMMQFGSMLKLMFHHNIETGLQYIQPSQGQAEDAFFVHLLDKGVAFHTSRAAYLSTAHTGDDIDIIIEAMVGASEETAADGLFRTLS